MGRVLVAEASPCCPSPFFGELVVIAYIVGGGLVYLWMLSSLFRWFRARHHRRGVAAGRDG